MVAFLAWWTVSAVAVCIGIVVWVRRHNAHLH